MSKQINSQGQIIDTKDVDGVVGQMSVMTTNITNAKVDFAGYLYKEKDIDGVTGRMPIVSFQEDEDKNTYTKDEVDALLSEYVKPVSGYWAPKINNNPLSNYTATVTDASYTKIGNRVNIRGYIAFTNAQSGTEQVIFTNLPFTAVTGRRQPVYIDSQGLVSNNSMKGVAGMVHPDTKTLQIYFIEEYNSLYTRPPLTMARVGAGSSFEFNFDYTTSE